jgi:hypothetical protein
MARAAARVMVAAMTSPRPLIRCLATLLALNAIGYVVALATGIVDPLPGFLNGSKTNAPLVIWGAQALGIALLLRGRRAGGALALLACTVSLVAVAFDGDLAADGLGTGQIAVQVAISATTAILWTLLVARLAPRDMVARWRAA